MSALQDVKGKARLTGRALEKLAKASFQEGVVLTRKDLNTIVYGVRALTRELARLKKRRSR